MKFLLQATQLVALASMALAQTSSDSSSSSSMDASSSSMAPTVASPSPTASSPAASSPAASSPAASSPAASSPGSPTSAGGASSVSSSAPNPTSTAGLPALGAGQYYAFGPNGQVFVVTVSQAKRKRQTLPAGSPSLQDCINQCANLGQAQCTQVIYNTAATSAGAVCSTGLFSCSPPPAGTTQAVLVGQSNTMVNIPVCLLQSGYAAAAQSSTASSGTVSSSSQSRTVTTTGTVTTGSSTLTLTGTSTSSSASASSSVVPGLAPTCPNDNGKTVTANGIGGTVAFTIVCGLNTRGKVRRSITDGLVKRQATASNAFGVCITACANTPNCQSLLFNPVNGACALFDCVATVPAGLSGAVRVGASTVCPPTTPTTVPVINNNINLNLNVSVNVNININAGTFQGLPYTQVCTSSCSPCSVCTPLPAASCSICQAVGQPAPLAAQPYFYPPATVGQVGYPAYCSTCGYSTPVAVSPAAANPASPATTGKYTGPYSNDAAGVKAAGSLLAGAAALAFALA